MENFSARDNVRLAVWVWGEPIVNEVTAKGDFTKLDQRRLIAKHASSTPRAPFSEAARLVELWRNFDARSPFPGEFLSATRFIGYRFAAGFAANLNPLDHPGGGVNLFVVIALGGKCIPPVSSGVRRESMIHG